MISSVIAIFDSQGEPGRHAMDKIASHPSLEVGELIDGRKLPITIEAKDNQQTEEITRWLSSLDGVACVDVVYVHFEHDHPRTI